MRTLADDRGDHDAESDVELAGGDVRVRVRRGSFYFGAALYERYFGGAQAIAVVGRGARIALIPLREQGSGGLLVKVRNLRGDRVIHASELLRTLGVDETGEHALAAEWDGDLAALTIANPAAAPGPALALQGGLESGR